MNILTQKQITDTYLAVLAGLDPVTNTAVSGTDWWFKGNGIGAIMSNAYKDLALVENKNYVQYMVGNELDLQLAELNLAPRFGGTLATGYVELPAPLLVNITIPYNTILFSGNIQYFVRQTTTILAGERGSVPIASQNTGSGQQLLEGSHVTFQTPLGSLTYMVVISMTDGGETESDGQVLQRILNYMANPPIAGNAQWYKNSVLTVPQITGAYTMVNVVDEGVVSLFTLSGNTNPDTILLYPDVMYSRTTNIVDLDNANNYIQSIRLELDVIQLATTNTYYFDDVIATGELTILVTLAADYTLDTLIDGLTVRDLIKRETRRAFITQPLGATELNTGSYILLKSIQESLDVGLNSANGIYAPILVNRTVLFDGAQVDIPVPGGIESDGNAYLVYDVSYNNITVLISSL